MDSCEVNERREYLINFIKSNSLKDVKILDVGAYPTEMIERLHEAGYDIKGLDYQNELKIKGKKVCFKCDIEEDKFPFKSNSFDLVIFSEVIEHLGKNPLHCLREIRRVLRKGGKLILTTDNRRCIHAYLKFLLFLNEGYYYELLKKEKNGFMGHITQYGIRDLKDILRRERFKIGRANYINFHSISDKKLGWFLMPITELLPMFKTKLFLVVEK